MFEWVARQVAETGLMGVFVLMVAENIFPPIPSEIIMAASGFAAARGEISLIGVIVIGVLGTVVGNAFWYEIGRWCGMDRIRPLVARYGKWFAFETEDMDRAERTLKRWGPFALCLGRVEPLAWVVVGGSIAAYALHLVYAFRRARRRRDQA